MSRDQEVSQEYEKLFAEFSNKMEYVIKRIIIVLITLLVIIQILLHIPGIAPLLSPVFDMEGIPLQPALRSEIKGNEE
ncbi:DUF5359 family protein [Paenibacillus urinalis]|uniref:DUF5359 family protein n=1 Tax=Paenibacillus urinalis TaxID=521520 RepID=A0ABY7X615_9BACL|nr:MULTISPECIES: DUF5359 family protein [Paenibacillus]WDH97306.1 DUF5359 family protein [Paenibacillus urinalis]WDI00969.1 DUF5359 family protein [Paenibacillus urinalis]GAK39985.1 hypothetical protein TCA2_2474 [Paenibacillus sp. TCA20]